RRRALDPAGTARRGEPPAHGVPPRTLIPLTLLSGRSPPGRIVRTSTPSCGPRECGIMRSRQVLGNPRQPDRRSFLAAGATGALAAGVVGAPASEFHADDFELAELTISDLSDGLAKGKFTARSLAEKYLERIEAIDRKGPTLRSVIEINPDALTIADA